MTGDKEDSANNMKKTFFIIIILIAIGVVVFFISSVFAPKTINLSVSNQSYKEESKEKNYTVNASYPQFSGAKDSKAEAAINENIKSFAEDSVKNFKTGLHCNFSDLGPDKPGWVCEFAFGSQNFNVVDQKILSLEVSGYWFTGGAHGGTEYTYLNYNLNTGEKLDWKNVFKKDSDYMKIISDYSKTDLEKQLIAGEDSMTDESWIGRGTEATEENYNTNVGFDKNGLIIIFQQYQVAAYAAGPQTVVVPYGALKDVIDPNSLLSKFAK